MITLLFEMERSIVTRLHQHICINMQVEVGEIHAVTGIRIFLIGRSHTLFRISEACADLSKDDNDSHS